MLFEIKFIAHFWDKFYSSFLKPNSWSILFWTKFIAHFWEKIHCPFFWTNFIAHFWDKTHRPFHLGQCFVCNWAQHSTSENIRLERAIPHSTLLGKYGVSWFSKNINTFVACVQQQNAQFCTPWVHCWDFFSNFRSESHNIALFIRVKSCATDTHWANQLFCEVASSRFCLH